MTSGATIDFSNRSQRHQALAAYSANIAASK